MNKSFQMLCLVSIALTPGLASAQAITAFDGTYTAVSRNVSGSGPNCSAFSSELRPLTVRNGAARFEAGLQGATVFQGNVTAQGDLTMRDNLSDQITAKIDQSGKATGAIHMGESNCVISAVWQKQ